MNPNYFIKICSLLFFQILFVMNIFAQETNPQKLIADGFVKGLASYKEDMALLVEAIKAEAGDSTFVQVSDLYLQDLDSYVQRAKRTHEKAIEQGVLDTQIDQIIAQMYAYQACALTYSIRQWPQAFALYDSARIQYPEVGQQVLPMPNATQADTLGKWMAHLEQWRPEIGRVYVTVNPQWVADSLRFTPLDLEPLTPSVSIDSLAYKVSKGREGDSLRAVVYDSLRGMAMDSLQSQVELSTSQFQIILPRRSFRLSDARDLLVEREIVVEDSTLLHIDPRVDFWLPATYTLIDTVKIQEVVNGVPSGQDLNFNEITFGTVYELLVHTQNYKRYQSRIFFHRRDFPKSSEEGVVSIETEPGYFCWFFDRGPGKLKKVWWGERSRLHIISGTLGLLILLF